MADYVNGQRVGTSGQSAGYISPESEKSFYREVNSGSQSLANWPKDKTQKAIDVAKMLIDKRILLESETECTEVLVLVEEIARLI